MKFTFSRSSPDTVFSINPFLFIVESFIIVNINIQNLYVCNMPIAWRKLCFEGVLGMAQKN